MRHNRFYDPGPWSWTHIPGLGWRRKNDVNGYVHPYDPLLHPPLSIAEIRTGEAKP